MRPLSAPLLAGLLVLLALAAPARAGDKPFDPLNGSGGDVVQPIGWSADEQRLAVRVYVWADEEEQEEDEEGNVKPPTFCPGYVDHKGKKFRGTLRLVAYEQGQALASYPIQDWECTPPEKARERLAAAKEALGKLGIDLTQPGTELLPTKGRRVTVKEGPGAPYLLEYETKLRRTDHPEDPHFARLRGTERVVLVQGKARTPVFSREVKVDYEAAMGGRYNLGFSRVWRSPSGRVLLLVGSLEDGGMRGYTRSLRLLSVLTWGGEPLVLR